MQLVSCSTASELNPFQKAARYSSIYTLAWEAKEGGLAPKAAGPQLARVHHGINTPDSSILSAGSSYPQPLSLPHDTQFRGSNPSSAPRLLCVLWRVALPL